MANICNYHNSHQNSLSIKKNEFARATPKVFINNSGIFSPISVVFDIWSFTLTLTYIFTIKFAAKYIQNKLQHILKNCMQAGNLSKSLQNCFFITKDLNFYYEN